MKSCLSGYFPKRFFENGVRGDWVWRFFEKMLYKKKAKNAKKKITKHFFVLSHLCKQRENSGGLLIDSEMQ